MIDVIRLTLGNGQSYENVSLLTETELNSSVDMLFGDETFAFFQKVGKEDKFILGHSDNILVIHLTRFIKPALEDSIPYEKVVLAHDAIYGPGQIYLPHHMEMFGIDPITRPGACFVPFLFSTESEGLMLINSESIASIECKAAYAFRPVPTKHCVPHRMAAGG